jgi:hypothetical protein
VDFHTLIPSTSWKDQAMAEALSAREQVLAMLAQGWQWRDSFSDVLVHPADHSLTVTYNRTDETLSMSAALIAALALVIPTPAGRSRRFWRDEQKSKTTRGTRKK